MKLEVTGGTRLPADRHGRSATDDAWCDVAFEMPVHPERDSLASDGSGAEHHLRRLVAAVAVLLCRATSEPTAVFGVTGRVAAAIDPSPDTAPEGAVRVLTIDVPRDATIAAVAANVDQAITAVAAGGSGHLPPILVDVADGTETGPSPRHRGSQLTLRFVPRAGAVGVHVGYDGAALDAASVARCIDVLSRLLSGAITTPDTPVRRLPVLDDAEIERIVHGWNRTGVTREGEQRIHRLFEAQVQRSPDALAVQFEQQHLTFGELDARANRLAQVLVARGVTRDTFVGLAMQRSTHLIVGLLAILKADGAFVPLDPELPDARLATMLRATGAPIVLVDDDTHHRIGELAPRAERVLVPSAHDDAPPRPGHPQAAGSATADDLAYVIFTSGSTGEPKGVLVTHRALCNHALWFATAVGMGAHDRMLLHASIGFDAAMAEIFAPLISGATVVLAPPDAHHELRELPLIVARERITVMQVVPSALRVVITSPDFAACAGLRFLVCGGEALDAPLCRAVRTVLPALRLGNFYGPSEATVDAASFECGPQLPDAGPMPIGRPIANATCDILDDFGAPVPVGFVGELHIGGTGLARGYLGDAELTRRRFIPDPFRPGARLYPTGDRARFLADGNIVFAGRVDEQVKVRGYRIELGEIELALRATGRVARSAVIVREDEDGDARLVAYVVPAPGVPFDAAAVRTALAELLSPWMVPTAFHPLDELPRTANGKLDLRRLPDVMASVGASAGEFVPSDPVEQTLLDLWRRTLGVEMIGPDDDFFSLGGHSLKVFRLITEIERQYNVTMRATTLFEAPTIRTLAAKVRELQDRDEWSF